jgi:7-carboxy-7-deazaguanine synthase
MSTPDMSGTPGTARQFRHGNLLVMEVYRSIQGEGTLMGVSTTFVRFFACNLRCSWCDTKHSWSLREGGSYRELTPAQVHAEVEALGARHVVLTGGEPCLQRGLPELARLLDASGAHVTVETAATIFPAAALPHVRLWSLSPKLPSAGEGYLRHPIIQRFLQEVPIERMQWKFVLRHRGDGDGDGDEAALRALLERYPIFRQAQLPILLQPESGSAAAAGYGAALEALVDRTRDPFWSRYHVRVLPQLHFLIWGSRRLV